MAFVDHTPDFTATVATLTAGAWVMNTSYPGDTFTVSGGFATGYRPTSITLTTISALTQPTSNFSVYDTAGNRIGGDVIFTNNTYPSGTTDTVFALTFVGFDIDHVIWQSYCYRALSVKFGFTEPEPTRTVPTISLTAPTATATGLTVRTGCTVLSVIQAACGRIGLSKPSSVFGNSDATATQMLGLLVEEVNDLSRKTQWQVLLSEASWVTVHAENQGSVEDLIPNMAYIVNDTIWNRSLRRPIFGPLTAARYEQNKAMYLASPWSQYKILGGNVKFYPIPAAGQSIYLMYVTTAVGTDYLGNSITDFSDDRDLPLLDCEAIRLGLIWRFKMAKGMEYAEDYAKYDRRVMDLIARDGTKPILDMGGGTYDIQPMIIVPVGSWGV